MLEMTILEGRKGGITDTQNYFLSFKPNLDVTSSFKHSYTVSLLDRHWLNLRMQNLGLWRDNCTIPFYTRNLSILDFGIHCGSWNPSPWGYQRWTLLLSVDFNTSYSLPPFNPNLLLQFIQYILIMFSLIFLS